MSTPSKKTKRTTSSQAESSDESNKHHKADELTSPFRYDQIGSFLRPLALKYAREQFKNGEIDAAQLKKVEQEQVKKIVEKQVQAGLKAVTDGEFPRSWYHFDALEGFKGIKHITTPQGYPFSHTFTRAEFWEVVGKVEFNPEHPFFANFVYLQSVTPAGIVPKLTWPSPAMMIESTQDLSKGGLKPPGAYASKTIDEYIEDVSKCYRDTIQHLYKIGCRYLQLDDCTWISVFRRIEAAKTDEDRAGIKAYADLIVKVINKSLEGRPADFGIYIHLCKGNYRSDYLCAAGYDDIVQYLAQINTDGWFLEYDDTRSGTFAPLKVLADSPNGKTLKIILGLITTKVPLLEKEEDVIARIHEAQKVSGFPLQNLYLSPQCGFSSTEEGNNITEVEQWAKIKLTIDVAKKVWKDA